MLQAGLITHIPWYIISSRELPEMTVENYTNIISI